MVTAARMKATLLLCYKSVNVLPAYLGVVATGKVARLPVVCAGGSTGKGSHGCSVSLQRRTCCFGCSTMLGLFHMQRTCTVAILACSTARRACLAATQRKGSWHAVQKCCYRPQTHSSSVALPRSRQCKESRKYCPASSGQGLLRV